MSTVKTLPCIQCWGTKRYNGEPCGRCGATGAEEREPMFIGEVEPISTTRNPLAAAEPAITLADVIKIRDRLRSRGMSQSEAIAQGIDLARKDGSTVHVWGPKAGAPGELVTFAPGERACTTRDDGETVIFHEAPTQPGPGIRVCDLCGEIESEQPIADA